MKLRAKDSFATSGLGVVHARQEFECHDALGKEIVDKGHAEVVEESTDTAAGAKQSEPAAKKAELPPLNKMDVPHADKAAAKTRAKPKEE